MFSFLLWANRLGLRAFFHSEPLAHSPCSEQIDWSLRGYILLHNLSTPLDLLRARRVGFESFLFTAYSVHMYTVYTVKITSQIPLALLWASRVEFRGYEIICILSNSSRFARSKSSGPEVLNEKKLSIPVDLLRARRKTSQILTNQKAAIYVQRIYSHSICSEQI